MTCIEEDMSSWNFPYNSNILDFIVEDDKENDRARVPHLTMPTKNLTEDLMQFLNSEELITKTPTTPSVTFRSIEDPLPSYDDNFATLTSANVNNVTSSHSRDFINKQLNPANLASLRAPASPHAAMSAVKNAPFSPSDVLAKRPIKQEQTEDADPILNFETLRNVSPLSDALIKEEQVDCNGLTTKKIDDYFRKENSMSISLDDISRMMTCDLDSFSPISPHSISSEGSTDTLLSSGFSDQEMSPKRAPVKKTRRRKVTEGGNCPHLWQFILELLGDKTHAEVISWTGVEHHFKVHNSRELARLWGARKNKPRMNFDKLSRAMRYYYDKNIIRHISGQRLVYEFCRNNEDTVYSKLLKDASRTMPLKPIISVTAQSIRAPKSSPPAYTPAPRYTSYTTYQAPSQPAQQSYNRNTLPGYPDQGAYQQGAEQGAYQQGADQGAYQNIFSGNQMFTEQYPSASTPEEQHFLSTQQVYQQLPSYIPNYTSNTAYSASNAGYREAGSNLNINIQMGGLYHEQQIKPERFHYTPSASNAGYSSSYPHYSPY